MAKKRRRWAGMAACLGAIGGDLRLGEVVAFLHATVHAWWLIPLSAMTLALLCAPCMDGSAAARSLWTCMRHASVGCALARPCALP